MPPSAGTAQIPNDIGMSPGTLDCYTYGANFGVPAAALEDFRHSTWSTYGAPQSQKIGPINGKHACEDALEAFFKGTPLQTPCTLYAGHCA